MYGKEFAFFLQVCRDGSLHKAAKSLYISPQGLSRAIQTLEHDLNVPLFERNKDGVLLTKYGEAIKPFAERIVYNADTIHQVIASLQREISGTLNLSCSFGAIGALGPALFHDFQKKFPEITLNIFESSDLQVQNMVTSADNTLGISVGPCKNRCLHETLLCSRQFVWLINKKNPLVEKKESTFSDLENVPLIMYSKEFTANRILRNGFRSAGITPNIKYYINESIMAYILCTKYNAVAATVDFIAEDMMMDHVVAKPVLDENCKWNLYLINRSEQKVTDVQYAFISHLLRATGHLQADNFSALAL